MATNVWVGIPFNMILLLPGLQAIPDELYEAAAIDGAGPWARFRHITIPLLKPVALSVILLGVIYTFKVFDVVFVLTGGGPVDATTVLPIEIYNVSLKFFRFGEGAAASTLLLLAMLVVAGVYLWLVRREEGRHDHARRHPYRKTAIAMVLVAILLFPVYWMVLTSLRSEADAGHSPPLLAPTHLQGDAYTTAVFENADIKQAIINSPIIALGTMLVTLLLAVPAAYVLARRRVRFVSLALLILLVAQLLPGIAVATPLFVIFKHLALLNSYLGIILADAT